MARAIFTCGKICCGKTTYAKQICKKENAVLLSVDEMMLALFGQHAGEKHDEYVVKIKKYLLEKSVEFIACGTNTVLDWGLWSKKERDQIKQYYTDKEIPCEIHYLDVNDEIWMQRIITRNKAISEGNSNAYFIDNNLIMKLENAFEKPDREEVAIWICC